MDQDQATRYAEEGLPEVQCEMTPEGIQVRVSAFVRGDGTDLCAETAATFLLETWAQVLADAAAARRLRDKYGVSLVLSAPLAATSPPAAPAPASPAPEESSPPIQPVSKRKHYVGKAAAAIDRAILKLLRDTPGQKLRGDEIRAELGHFPESTLRYRLSELTRKGALVYRLAGFPRGGGYMLPNGDGSEDEAPRPRYTWPRSQTPLTAADFEAEPEEPGRGRDGEGEDDLSSERVRPWRKRQPQVAGNGLSR